MPLGAIDDFHPQRRPSTTTSSRRRSLNIETNTAPFKSIMDLNQVLDPSLALSFGFQNRLGEYHRCPQYRFSACPANYSPSTPRKEIIRRFPLFIPSCPQLPPMTAFPSISEKTFLAVTRISNLVTTRSDSYTCYVLVQGWRNAGTPQATLVAQKRTAFIIDRSGISSTNLTPAAWHPIPTP